MVLAVALLAFSGSLAAVLRHDGIDTGIAPDGESTLRGVTQPFVLPKSAAWSDVARHLDNHTYQLRGAGVEPGTRVLITAPTAIPTGDVVVRGPVVARLPDPAYPSRTILILRADSWDLPLLR